jgi:formyl-CoA transferase
MTGLRVIDLTRVLGGPYCTQILADLGADVIKVEPPAGTRCDGALPSEEDAAYFVGINRGSARSGRPLPTADARCLEDAGDRRRLIENFCRARSTNGASAARSCAKFPKRHCRFQASAATARAA